MNFQVIISVAVLGVSLVNAAPIDDQPFKGKIINECNVHSNNVTIQYFHDLPTSNISFTIFPRMNRDIYDSRCSFNFKPEENHDYEYSFDGNMCFRSDNLTTLLLRLCFDSPLINDNLQLCYKFQCNNFEYIEKLATGLVGTVHIKLEEMLGEDLYDKSQCRWHNHTTDSHITTNDQSDEICGFGNGGDDFVPGKLHRSINDTKCYDWANREMKEFLVLRGCRDISWYPVANGIIPSNALIRGYQHENKYIYICKSEDSIGPGCKKTGCLINGKYVTTFHVLVYNEPSPTNSLPGEDYKSNEVPDNNSNKTDAFKNSGDLDKVANE